METFAGTPTSLRGATAIAELDARPAAAGTTSNLSTHLRRHYCVAAAIGTMRLSFTSVAAALLFALDRAGAAE